MESKQIKQGDNTGAWSTNQAFNALAMLAFMSSGHTPGRGKYGDVIEDGVVKPGVLTRGKKYMLSKAQPTGYISSGVMYEHGLSTLCLAEMYGMDPDPELEDKLRKAVDLIVKCQSPAGGWRYSPAPVDQDLSVTVMQVVALRAANNAGIPVPKETFEKATQVRAVVGRAGRRPASRPAVSAIRDRATRRRPAPAARSVSSSWAITTTRHPADADVPDDGPGARMARGGQSAVSTSIYFHYYAIQAFYQAGGKEWNDWHPEVRELLLKHQNNDGSWDVPPGRPRWGT